MLKFVVRRLLLLIPILLGLSILVFFWIRALPGGPAEALLGERATPESIAADRRSSTGSTSRVYVQYWSYVKTTVSGDLGTSITTRRPVTDELKQRFPATIELTIAAHDLRDRASASRSALSPPSATGRAIDHASLVVSLLGVSIPVFFLAILLKYVFAVKLGLLPTVGRISATIDIEHPTNFYLLDALLAGDMDAFWDVIKHLILPAIALGSIPLAITARITRASVLDVQNEDYVRTARAKGLPPRVVDERHIFRNALLPIVTIIGLQAGLLLSGAVLTETVFAWPGHGHLARGRDQGAQLPGAPGRDPLRLVHLRARQPARRRLVRVHQPADPGVLMSIAEVEAREVELEAPSGLWHRRLAPASPQPRRDRRLRPRRDLRHRCALFAPLIATHGPREQNLSLLQGTCCPGPSADHLFGVDAPRARSSSPGSSTAPATRC